MHGFGAKAPSSQPGFARSVHGQDVISHAASVLMGEVEGTEAISLPIPKGDPLTKPYQITMALAIIDAVACNQGGVEMQAADFTNRPLGPTNITLKQGSEGFNYKVSGLFLNGERVLLNRLIGYRDWTAWSLPGGRVELMENSKDAIRREMKEEIGVDVTVGRLLWVSESFFRDADGATHELCLCYLLSFPAGSQFEQTLEFHGYDDGYKIVFKWFDIRQLHTLELRPSFLGEKIPSVAPVVEHLIHTEGK